MKKIVTGLFVVVVLMVLTSSVVMAGQPDGVGKPDRFFVDAQINYPPGVGFCPVCDTLSCDPPPPPCSSYTGSCFIQESAGATQHFTMKCKLGLVSGPPVYDYFYFSEDVYMPMCTGSYSYEGEKLIVTRQCTIP